MIDSIILYAYLLAVFGSLYKIFTKAGVESWKGFVPGLNYYYWLKILKKPWWWLFLLIIPGVNFLMIIILNVQLSWAFGKISRNDTLLAIFLPFYVLPQLGYKDEEKFIGPHKWRDPKNKNWKKDWTDAILFAVIAATIIRTFFLEAFTIPTGSMEKSLLKGDFLFVSKMTYGPRVPMTPIAFPFVHHTLPFTTSTPSFINWWTLPFFRILGYGSIHRNDVVVFNFPEGDTVVADIQDQSYYQILRDATLSNGGTYNDIVTHSGRYQMARKFIWSNHKILVRPVDKQENYIKRCVAISGDTIQVINRQLYVNGKPSGNTETMQYQYFVYANNMPDSMLIKEKFDISFSDVFPYRDNNGHACLLVPMSDKVAEDFAKLKGIDSIRVMLTEHPDSPDTRLSIYPNHPKFFWSQDFFGPFWIPKAGATIELTPRNIILYRRPIEVYEHNTLEIKDGKVYINGKQETSYTFKMNYYWLMGDNRHNSQDSRYWGVVPEDHVVGKGSFIFFSKDPELSIINGGIRWNRLFSFVH